LSEAAGRVADDERVEVSVVLKPRQQLESIPAQPLTREQYAAQYGAAPEALAAVEDFARKHGLEVVESSAARNTVRLAGRAADVSAAFGVSLSRFRGDDGAEYRAPTSEVQLPPELRDIVQGVFGLDTRPVARHYE
jgi:kumamolisin